MNWQNVEQLKSSGHYFTAGALAFEIGHSDSYGCHFGMRSDLEHAREEFRKGFYSAKRNKEQGQ